MHKRMIIVLGLLFVGNSGCAKKYKGSLTELEYQKAVAGKKPIPASTLLVSGEQLTIRDVMEAPTQKSPGVPLVAVLSPEARSNNADTFKEMANLTIKTVVDGRVGDILLYQKAKREAPDKIDETLKKAAEQRWREFVIQHDMDEAKADKTLQSQGLDRKAYIDSQQRAVLSYAHFNATVPRGRPISAKEIRAYYTDHLDQYETKAKIQFSLIDIQPSKMGTIEDSYGTAMYLVEDLQKKLHAGADFSELAKKHSHGFLKNQGGQWPSRSPDEMAKPFDVLARRTATMRVGDIVGPIEAPDHLFILRLDAKQEKGHRPLGEVQAEIQNAIRNERFQKAQDELFREIEERRAAGKTDGFIDKCADEIYRRSNQ